MKPDWKGIGLLIGVVCVSIALSTIPVLWHRAINAEADRDFWKGEAGYSGLSGAALRDAYWGARNPPAQDPCPAPESDGLHSVVVPLTEAQIRNGNAPLWKGGK